MKYSYIAIFFLALCYIGCTPKSATKKGTHQYSNELINESSPYLLQHAHNPVNWYPWGEKALKKAKDEDKLMIISVGYAACHWCHVMEHESFEDSLVAEVMNEHFICVKVDREERPDVDEIYMTACQLSSGKGCGWPLNAFALPDGRPVFATTYMPKKQWTQTLESFVSNYQNDSLRMVEYAERLTEGIEGTGSIDIVPVNESFKAESLENSVQAFIGQIDKQKGGRKGSPKFPMPNNYEFLMEWSDLYGNEDAMKAVTTTLDNMAYGGIYDQLGGGFARYSVDSKWLAPHFEKMLYDNGQLVSLYAKAYQKTKNPTYKRIVEETLSYIKREMSHNTGGFYSSLDADSEGEEGKFYVWTAEEVDKILGKQSKVFKDYYDVRPMGNWEGHTILNIPSMTDDGMEPLQESKARLFVERAKRIRPGLDDKILTSWNALMNMGYVDAYKALGDEAYKEAALKNGEFLLKTVMQNDGRLNRNYKDGKSVINAFLDDYALTIQAFAKLYEITFDEKWLNQAEALANYAIAHFYNPKTKMFNYTSDLDAPLVAQKIDLTDNVIPGSNSSMAKSLVILGTYLYKTEYIDTAKQMLSNMENELVNSKSPSFYSNWLNVYQMIANPPFEIAIVGNDFETKRNELMKHYLPNALLLGGKKEGNLELLKDKLQEGETMIYVCQNKSCKLPTPDVAKALSLMK